MSVCCCTKRTQIGYVTTRKAVDRSVRQEYDRCIAGGAMLYRPKPLRDVKRYLHTERTFEERAMGHYKRIAGLLATLALSSVAAPAPVNAMPAYAETQTCKVDSTADSSAPKNRICAHQGVLARIRSGRMRCTSRASSEPNSSTKFGSMTIAA